MSRCGARGIDLCPVTVVARVLKLSVFKFPKLILDRGLSKTPGPSMESVPSRTHMGAHSWWDAGPQSYSARKPGIPAPTRCLLSVELLG